MTQIKSLLSLIQTKTTFILVLILLTLPCFAFPFDGNRKGLVAGFGFGFTPYAYWNRHNSVDETNTGTAVKVLLGYGFNEKNVLAYEISGVSVESDLLNSTELIQGLNGIIWYHSKIAGATIYSSLGIGKIGFVSEFSNVGGRGFGGQIGVGLELKRHFQLDVIYLIGRTTSKDDVNFDHQVLLILFTALAY